MTSDPRTLARRLRQLRAALGLTQSSLAKVLSKESGVQAPTISTWESPRAPVRPSEARLEQYARLSATATRAGDKQLIAAGKLTDSESVAYTELLEELNALWESADRHETVEAGVPESPQGLWDFQDNGPLAIVCPSVPAVSRGELADPNNPNYTEALGYADLDALIDLYGHIRMEVGGRFPVHYYPADHYRLEHLSSHLVLLGGIGWNELTRLLQPTLTRLPVKQVEVDSIQTGEIFEATVDGATQQFLPEWSKENEILHRDVGYIARTRNPYNPHRTLTICNGIHSRGVLGAVRTLTDIQFREENETYLADTFPSGEFAILIRVPVIAGRALGVALSDPDVVLYSWSGEDAPPVADEALT